MLREIRVEFIALLVARSLIAALDNGGACAIPRNKPIRIASAYRHVINADLLIARAVHDCTFRFSRQIFPGRLVADA